jgi:glycosyltransferase involved in cell wall biosynthesis
MRTITVVNLFNGTGGGVRVALHMVNILLRRGYRVRLFALDGLPVEYLDRIHGTSLSTYLGNSLSMKYYNVSKGTYSFFSRLRFFSLSRYINMIRDVVSRYDSDLIILFDDIPPLEWDKVNSSLVVYSHFPYAARLLFNIYDMFDTENVNYFEVIKERFFRKTLLWRYFYAGNIKNWNIKVLANSTITSIYAKKTWGINAPILYPPVFTPRSIKVGPDTKKKNLIVSLGVISPGKYHGTVIDAFAMVKRRINNVKLTIIGSLVDKNYYNHLLRKIKVYNLKNDVYILTNISEETKWIILSQAKILVHAKRFEPFGIAVAEGMVAGAIPVVYKGPTSGPWIDIVDKGRYGIGFRTVEEFAEAIEYIMNAGGTELSELQEKAYKGSQGFSFDKFERNITRLLESLVK